MAWEHDGDDSKHRVGGTGYPFKSLSDAEEEAYRQYARDNDPEDMSHWTIYHPVCREEWEKRGFTPNRVD